MDLLEREEAPELVLTAAKSAYDALPVEPLIARNYGRALMGADQTKEAIEVLKKAAWLPGAIDIEPNYLATALASANNQRGALEADLLACTRDPDDGRNFIRSCIALTLAAEQDQLEPSLRASLFRSDVISKMILDALSCRLLSSDDRRMAGTLIRSGTLG